MIFSKKFEAPEIIIIANKEFKIKLEYYSKRSSSVSIKNNVLDFRMSKFLIGKQKENHFNELLNKISKKIEKEPHKFNIEDTFEKCLENEKFEFHNEIYFLEYTNKRGIKLNRNIFYINHLTNKEIIKKKIIKLLISKYQNNIKNYVLELNKQSYNYNIKDVEIKSLDSKWGHCTHDNKIMLNLKLLNTDNETFNYVIYHELSHIKEKNHSNNFWREVSRFCPNYKVLRKRLRTHPPDIFKIK